ncbi:MAG: DPP IV N-terminal domain-containing protein [Myxococcota bacterium]
MIRPKPASILPFVLVLAASARADAPVVDGPHPGFLRDLAQTRSFNLGRPVGIKPTPDGKTVLFLRAPPREPRLHLHELDTTTGQSRELLTPAALLAGAEEKLTVEERARRERMRISVGGFTSFDLSDDGKLVLLSLSGKLYILERATGATRELPIPPGALDPRFTPDGKSVSYVRDHDVHLLDLATHKERRITTGGSELVSHGLAEFVAQEEMSRMRGYWWSPDARTLIYEESDTRDVEQFFISDPTHPESSPTGFRYPRPGRKNAVVKLGIVGAQGGKTTWVSWDVNAFPYVAKVDWEKNAPPTVLVQSRDQRHEVLLSVDPTTGKTTPLLEERDDAWLNLDPEMPRWLPDGKSFLWTTERNGAWELELHDRKGAFIRTVVPMHLGYRSLADVDAEQGHVFFHASVDPTQTHLYRGLITGSDFTQLTTSPGHHAALFSKDHRIYVETLTSSTDWRRSEVHRADGSLVGVVPAVNEMPPFKPNVEWVRVGEGAGLHAVVIRPRAFDRNRRYPVVVRVYGGPHYNIVNRTLEQYLADQWLADHGYILVSIDGRGTPRRGRAWERAIAGDFGAIPLQDQVTGLKALGMRYPEMDLSRVGVLGWSFGGYMAALAVLRRPDVFKTAMAGAPVVDWLDYDTHYTERYLGLPDVNAKGYDQSNLLTYAGKLERPLLLIHGTADDNVYFFHTLRLSDALLRSGRRHTVLPLSGFTHMVSKPEVVEAMWTRVVDHLGETLQPGRNP